MPNSVPATPTDAIRRRRSQTAAAGRALPRYRPIGRRDLPVPARLAATGRGEDTR